MIACYKPTIYAIGDDAEFKMGKYCSIAEGCVALLQVEHRPDWITTFPFSHVSNYANAHKIKGHPTTKGDIIIGNDVWIGWQVTLMSGITIGDGACIGAHSVVTKDIPPYWIAAGNPAKLIRQRFPDHIVERLLEIKWWDWPHEKIEANILKLCDDKVEEFVKEFSDFDNNSIRPA